MLIFIEKTCKYLCNFCRSFKIKIVSVDVGLLLEISVCLISNSLQIHLYSKSWPVLLFRYEYFNGSLSRPRLVITDDFEASVMAFQVSRGRVCQFICISKRAQWKQQQQRNGKCMVKLFQSITPVYANLCFADQLICKYIPSVMLTIHFLYFVWLVQLQCNYCLQGYFDGIWNIIDLSWKVWPYESHGFLMII